MQLSTPAQIKNAVYTNGVTWVPNGYGIDVADPLADAGITDLGDILVSGFVANNSSADFSNFVLQYPGVNIAGQPDELLLIIRAVNGTPEMSGGINFSILD